MATLADLTTKVKTLESKDDQLIALLKGLRDQIAALQPNQAAIDALATELDAEIAKVDAAATPPPEPAPAPPPAA